MTLIVELFSTDYGLVGQGTQIHRWNFFRHLAMVTPGIHSVRNKGERLGKPLLLIDSLR
jgi:hypothetical protein